MESAVLDAPESVTVRTAPNAFDVRTFALVRTLYLVQGLNPSEIEAMGIGLTRAQVSNLASREGWSQKRKESAIRAEQTAIARADSAVSKVAEAIAIESEELCFAALKETRAGLSAGGLLGAKQAQAASSTLKNLAGVAVQLRDPGKTQPGEGASLTLNMFFAGAASKGDVKQVTEISATAVK